MTVLMLVGVVAAALWSNSRLRAVNERLEREIDRADRNAQGSAGFTPRPSERHALGAQLRLAAQALDAAQPERAQQILRDIPLNAGARDPALIRLALPLAHGPAVKSSCCSGPARASRGWRFRPTASSSPPATARAGLQLWDAASGAWIRDMQTDRRPDRRPDLLAGRFACRRGRPQCRRAVVRTAFRSGRSASGRRLARLPMDRASMRSRARFLPRRVLLGSGHRDKPPPPPLTRLWSLADDPAHPRLLGQYRTLRGQRLRHRPEAGSSRSKATSSIVLRDVRTGEPNCESFMSSLPTENITRMGQLARRRVCRRRDRARSEIAFMGRTYRETARESLRSCTRSPACTSAPTARTLAGIDQ